MFNINVSKIWRPRHNLIAYSEFVGNDGKKIAEEHENKETLTFDKVNVNYATDNMVRYVLIPNNLLKERNLTVRYTIENPNNGEKVVSEKAIVIPELQSGGVAASGAGNLLKNPTAEQGINHWVLYGKGGTIKSDLKDRGDVYYTEAYFNAKPHYYQDVLLPVDSGESYLAMAGYVSVDNVVANSIARHPMLNGYILGVNERIISYLQGETLRHNREAKCWQAVWGIFKIPSNGNSVRLFLDQAAVKGDDPNGTRAYYDDLELRIFKTGQEAEEFISNYKKEHP